MKAVSNILQIHFLLHMIKQMILLPKHFCYHYSSFHTQIHVNIDPSDSFVLVFVLVWCKVMQETLKTPSSHKSDISIHVIQLHLQLSILVNKSISGWCTSVHMSPYSSSLSNMITTCLTISSFKLSVLVKIIMSSSKSRFWDNRSFSHHASGYHPVSLPTLTRL